jgi:hypothetical protein
MRYSVVEGFRVSNVDGDEHALEAHLDAMLDALLDAGAIDADIGGSLAFGDVQVSLMVEASSFEAAQAAASKLVNGAIQAAGGFLVDSRNPEEPSSRPAFDLRSVGAEVVSS